MENAIHPGSMQPNTSTASDQTEEPIQLRKYTRRRVANLVRSGGVGDTVFWLPYTDTAVQSIIKAHSENLRTTPSADSSPSLGGYPLWLNLVASMLLALLPLGFVLLLVGYSSAGSITMVIGFAALWIFSAIATRRRHLWRR